MAEHEQRVAERCSDYLSRIHPAFADWGEMLGRWHDLGKYAAAFQDYIRKSSDTEATSESKPGRVDHSTAGAQHAFCKLPKPIADLFAYAIAGHHSGLPDRVSSTGQRSSGLDTRLKKRVEDWSAAPAQLLTTSELALPVQLLSNKSAERCGFQLSLLCRMLFSALCDADFLATEQFMAPDLAKVRTSPTDISLIQMSDQLDSYLTRFDRPDPSEVGSCRAEVLAAARNAAERPRGIYA